jgi:hypothetical protein
MTWAQLIADGRGVTDFRLEIEGLAYHFVTSPEMEAAISGATAGRIAGLDREGITLGEQVDPARATLELEGMSLRILEDRGSVIGDALAYHATRKTFLAEDVGTGVTSFDVSNAASAGIVVGTIIHIGTECMRVTNVSTNTLTVTREIRGTSQQAHYTGDGGLHPPHVVYVDRHAGLEGRRANLYAYGRGDSPTGDGTRIWRGVCQTDARLDDTGAWWELNIGGLDVLHKQDLGVDLEEPFYPRGIYYPWSAPMVIVVQSNNDPIGVTPEYTVFAGFYENVQALIDDINATLDVSSFSGLTVEAVEHEGGWALDVTRTGDALTDAILVQALWRGVMLIGTVDAGPEWQGFQVDASANRHISGLQTANLTSGATYRYPGGFGVPHGAFGRYGTEGGSWVVPIGSAQSGRESNVLAVPVEQVPQRTDLTNDHQQFYIDRQASLSTLDALQIEWQDGLDPSTESYDVITSGTGTARLRIRADQFRLQRYWTPNNVPTLKLKRALGFGGLADFRSAIITNGPTYANLGSMPFITDNDWGDWSAVDEAESQSRLVAERSFSAFEAVKLEDVLVQEWRIRAVYPHTDSDGKITLSRLKVPTATDAVVATIDESYQIHPARASFEIGGLGSINTVRLRTGYDPIEDEHIGRTYVARDIEAYARIKAPRELEIAPLSEFGDRQDRSASLVPSEELYQLMLPVLGVMGRPYAIITVDVDMRLFSVLCGDVVTVTASHLPNLADGGRGGTYRGFVIGRQWELAEGRGQLRIFSLIETLYGWAPSLTISSESSGTLTVSKNDPYGVASMWQAGDELSDHFAVGDQVQAREYDDASPTIVTATIDAIDDGASEIDVTWDSAFTFGSSKWILEFQPAGSVVAGQVNYAFLGDTDGEVSFAAGDAVRTWAP